MRVIIAGSRKIPNPEWVEERLGSIFHDTDFYTEVDEVITGGARGADTIGNSWAEEYGFPTRVMLPQWDEYGRGAGHRRNAEMAARAAEEPDGVLIAFWDGKSPGTAGMIQEARRKGLRIYVEIIPLGV